VFSIAVAALFLAAICGLAARGAVPVGVPIVYVTASVAAVIAYAVDKSAAQRGAWRTRETTLHLLALMGGWPGALVAQHLFRHKSRKPSFQLAFRATVAVNCAVLAWIVWR
jgi:uncharacterized membrane protein YsdA (DUF1294 family)